jgi:hypothetical protein
MPFQYVDAEPFMEHNGVTIYHDYKDDSFGDILSYHYATDPADEHTFDVRELDTEAEIEEGPNFLESVKAVIREALDRGLIQREEDEDVDPLL